MRVLHVAAGSPWPTGYRSDQLVEPWMPGETRIVRRALGDRLISTFAAVFVDADAIEIEIEDPPLADLWPEIPAEVRTAIDGLVAQAPAEAQAGLAEALWTLAVSMRELTSEQLEAGASPEARLARAVQWVSLGAPIEAAAEFERVEVADILSAINPQE